MCIKCGKCAVDVCLLAVRKLLEFFSAVMALRILVQLFFLAHVGDVVFERAKASNPALRFILCGAAQIQAFPSSAEDHSEAVGLWNQTCHLSQTLRLTALPHTLHLRHTD